MNRIYYVNDKDGSIGFLYIADTSAGRAKIDYMAITGMDCYADVRARLAKGVDGKCIYTETLGEISNKETFDNNLLWWNCEKCGCMDYKPVSDGRCKCLECGHEYDVSVNDW